MTLLFSFHFVSRPSLFPKCVYQRESVGYTYKSCWTCFFFRTRQSTLSNILFFFLYTIIYEPTFEGTKQSPIGQAQRIAQGFFVEAGEHHKDERRSHWTAARLSGADRQRRDFLCRIGCTIFRLQFCQKRWWFGTFWQGNHAKTIWRCSIQPEDRRTKRTDLDRFRRPHNPANSLTARLTTSATSITYKLTIPLDILSQIGNNGLITN